MEDFIAKVYDLVAQIPPGKVATYGQIAEMAGRPRHARMVGWALGHMPPGLDLPCHRVVNASGGLAPTYCFGGYEVQRDLLEAEGVTFRENGRIDLQKHLW